MIIDNALLNEYNKYYFDKHKRAKKPPLPHPYHPSLNVWTTMTRVQANDLKQKWKDFGVWWMNKLGLANSHLDKAELEFTTYMPTKRRIDVDNTVPKFIIDAFVESGFIIDDDSNHILSLTLKCGYDKDNPRTEILVIEKGEYYE